jgi:hypothetical protein
MSSSARKVHQRPLDLPVFLYTAEGQPLGACRMREVSGAGATLASAPGDLPEMLLLSLSRNGKVRRHCRLMWRSEDEIGVHFQLD